MDEDDILREAGEELLRRADVLAAQESVGDTFTVALQQGMKELTGIVFSSDLDFMTKFLIVICQISLVLLLFYLVVPMSLRRKLEHLDFDGKLGGYLSASGGSSIFFAVVLGVFKMQKAGISVSAEEKIHENHIEREFRLRQQFFADIHTYLAIVLVGIWLTMNFIMKVNRRREECQALIEGRAPADKAEPVAAAKPDAAKPAAAKKAD